MGFAIILSDVRGNANRLVGWKATIHDVIGWDRCDSCDEQDHHKPYLGCEHIESGVHKNPKDAIYAVAKAAAHEAISHVALREFAEQIA